MSTDRAFSASMPAAISGLTGPWCLTYEAGLPQFAETSYTAGKVFFNVATDEDFLKPWLGGADRLCSRV
jgi:hypothetical protein